MKILNGLFLMLLFACKEPKQPPSASATSAEAPIDKESQRAQEIRDSIAFIAALDTALNYARENSTTPFTHQFEFAQDSTSLIKIKMMYGPLFTTEQKHLLIRRITPWAVVLNTYLFKGQRFQQLFEHEQSNTNYMSDTLQDVNGDNKNDVLVHWYPASGCCRRDVCDVRLFQPATGTFTPIYRFINPTFYPQQKMIRGVEYGHPGEVPLYKYKWRGLTVDTIEFIYRDTSQKMTFIKTKTQDYPPSKRKGIILHQLPKEYEKINSIEWFLL